MRTLKSTTGNVRHVPALGDGTLCNGVGASRGNVRWYWSNGAADCKRCLKLLPGVIAQAEVEAHAVNAEVASQVEQPTVETTPATGTGSLAAASSRTVAGVRAARTRVSIATQIAEACTALGIELGNEGVRGEARYVVNGQKYRVVELADLVLEGGFEGAYGRAETIVRQDSPLKPAPLTLTEAAEKITAEYSDALKALGAEEYAAELDARAKAHPYRPAVGELVVGTLKSVVTGNPIGGLTIGVFEGVDTRYGLAHLRGGHMVAVVDIDSMRPAPVVPDASHLVGVELTAELAVGDHSLRTGVVASVLRPSADGRYVVVQFEKPATWVVRVPVEVVERTASMTVSCVEKLPALEGREHWGVRVVPRSTLVNLVVAQVEQSKQV
jgi:hypothetical protein